MVTVYTPELPMAILANQLEEGQNFSRSGKQYITDVIIISNGITLLKNTGISPNYIKEWNRKPDNSKTWSKLRNPLLLGTRIIEAPGNYVRQ